MSAFGKVSYTENDGVNKETLQEDLNNQSTVDEQVDKFDNSYNVKLQELYDEYGKITIDEDKIKEVTMIKANALSKKVPFRVALFMTTSIIVTLLFAFLCIYNISVINSMGSNIDYLQEEVVNYQSDLVEAQSIYNGLTNKEDIQKELIEMGYGDVASSNIVAVTVPDKVNVEDLQSQTNWFDAICNFIAQIFG